MQKRRYADVDFGQIHYRTAGSGPNLLLLHQSPRTSAEYIDLIETLSDDYRVIAPDNPGNGMSDPLPQSDPAMTDYATALIDFLNALSIDRTLVYGFHTGASIATATAAMYPERIVHAAANGLAVYRGTEREDILANYAPPFDLEDDGSHLDWLWQRFKRQSKHFPWYKTDEASRIEVPPYSAEKCQGMVTDILVAGNNYIAPYHAAFAFDPVADGLLPANNLTVLSSKTDPLHPCMALLPEAQATFCSDSNEACLEEALRVLALHKSS